MFRGGRGSRRLLRVAVAVWLGFAVPFVAGVAEADETGPAQRIFDALGVEAEIRAVVPFAAAELTRVPLSRAADRARLHRIVRIGFAQATLEHMALDAFSARLDREHAARAARWLARAEIQRLYAAGRRAGSCQGDVPMASGRRARALARIRAAIDVEARARGHALRVFAAMLRAANEALPETRRYTPVELAAMLAAQREGLGPWSVGSACSYREFSTSALLSAQAFLESETGRWLHASVSAAVEQALARAARATARRIVESFAAPVPHRGRLRVAGAAAPRSPRVAGGGVVRNPRVTPARPPAAPPG